MKKLMFAIAVIAMTVGAQAATADWSYVITGAATDTAYSTGYKAYLIDAAVWEGLNGNVTADDLASKSLDSSAIKYKDYSGRSTKTYNFATENSAGTVGGLRDVSNASWGSTHDFYVVLVNENVDPDAFTATKQTLTTHGAADAPNTTGTFSTTQTALNGATWTAVSVPEPTSGLLMIVGLGALALRRRRA